MSFWDFLRGVAQRLQVKPAPEARPPHNELEGKKLRYLIGASDEDLREQGIELKSKD